MTVKKKLLLHTATGYLFFLIPRSYAKAFGLKKGQEFLLKMRGDKLIADFSQREKEKEKAD